MWGIESESALREGRRKMLQPILSKGSDLPGVKRKKTKAWMQTLYCVPLKIAAGCRYVRRPQ
jgi:hypothetical protein